jgi:N utilization substance protein B
VSAAVRAGTKNRRRALEILHAADVAGGEPSFGEEDAPEVRALVNGVRAHHEEIDALVRKTVEHWALERMPVVDRNLIRMGIYELTQTKAPQGPVIEDAVILAKLLSTEESGRFVNGVLGRIAREQRA